MEALTLGSPMTPSLQVRFIPSWDISSTGTAVVAVEINSFPWSRIEDSLTIKNPFSNVSAVDVLILDTELYVTILSESIHCKYPPAVTVVHLSTAVVLRHTIASVPITV